MSDPVQTPLQPPPLPAAPPGPPHNQLQRWLLYLVMLPAAAALCVQMSLLPPLAKMFGSAVAMAAFWIGFYALNPHGVRLVLIGCILLNMARFPSISVALLVASALAGEAGARLTRADAEEDDFFFVPLLTGAATMGLMIALGAGDGWGVVAGRISRALEPWVALMKQSAQQFQDLPEAFYSKKLLLTMIALGWALALWVAGRLARRAVGRLRVLRTSLIMFRIHVRYIFLLILGLILEIFSSLATSDSLSNLAWPILGVVALAGFLDGLGVALFLAAVRRMAGKAQEAFWITVAGIATALYCPQIVALIGLIDVWFDFRKLERLRRQLEEESGARKEE